ncbi:MAG: hypothetical protein KBD16_01615 [Candidatus Pacebacteria bacterium]|nr:hypothetical protein [Candidatus Paceibacterota bacterium]
MLGRRFTSERARKQHTKRVMLRIVLWVILAASLFFLIVELTHIKQLRVERVRFEGNHAISDRDLWKVTEPYLAGRYYGLFSKKNILIVENEAIEKHLLAEFVRLENTRVERSGFHTLVVTSTERKPKAIWCGGGESTGRSCYYLDQNALAFSLAPKLSGGTFVTFSRPFPERVIGKNLLPTGEFHTLRDFIDSLIALGFHTERVTWKDDAIELFVRAELEDENTGSLILRIPLTAPYDLAFSNLASVIKTSTSDEQPLTVSDIEYIDLRFENKVFYKKEATSDESEVPESLSE